MIQLFEKASWKKCRKGYMQAARDCRNTLTDPTGYWRYAPTDPRVAEAVAKWVERAKQAQGIIMERRPVCYAVTNAGSGNVYAVGSL